MTYDHLSTFLRPTELRSCQCAVCSRWFAPADVFTVEDEPNGTVGHACQACAAENNGPGKFEANHDDEAVATALVLYAWSMDSGEDDQMSSEGYGYCGRFGRYLLFQDDRGFVTFEECKDVASAVRRFEELYKDGMGAQEDDAYIFFDRGAYHVQIEGKTLGKYERETRARAAVSLEARRSGFYPSLWMDLERGGLRNVSYW